MTLEIILWSISTKVWDRAGICIAKCVTIKWASVWPKHTKQCPNECPDQPGHLHNQSPRCMLEEISQKWEALLPPLFVSTYIEALEGGPFNVLKGIPYPWKWIEKYHQLVFTQIQKALYHHVPKNTLIFHKSIPYPFNYFANNPISLNPFQGLYNTYADMV